MSFIKNFTAPSVIRQMLWLSLPFALMNIAAIIYFDLQYIRLARIITTVAVFIFFVVQVRHYSIWFYVIYTLLLCTSFGFYLYDEPLGQYLYLIPATSMYAIIGLMTIRHVEWSLIRPYEYVSYFLIYAANVWFHFYNVNSFEYRITSEYTFILVLLIGVVGLSTCIVVAFSHATKNTYDSAYLTYATFAFIFADFAVMLAYYFEISPRMFYFIERANYLFALYILTRYCLSDYLRHKGESDTIKNTYLD